MSSGKNRIQTKDCSCFEWGSAQERNVSGQCGEFRKEKSDFRDNSKTTITCYIHSQPYVNHLNGNLNYNS